MAMLWALAAAAVLEGYAVLPADTFMPGPRSGQYIDAGPGIETPFQGQPAQGFSAIAPYGDGGYYVLSDNGYGQAANSFDFILRIYLVTPDFRTAGGGGGTVRIDGYITLSDPLRRLGFTTTARRATYDGAPDGLPVDASIRAQSWLTGADLDPESLTVAPDGSFWIGEEIGPFLLHFDAAGELLEPPWSVPGLASPDRAGVAPDEVTVRRSGGFEGMAAMDGGRTLVLMLEAPLPGSDGALNLYRFDTVHPGFAQGGEPAWRYRLDAGAAGIGAFKLDGNRRGLVLERDDGQGATARLKKVYAVDLDRVESDGTLAKREIVDLLDIRDPHDLDGDGSDRFAFTHWTPECLQLLEPGLLLVVNDNNYPFGRARDDRRPDATEFIIVRFDD